MPNKNSGKNYKGSKIHNRNSSSAMSVICGESTEPKTTLLFCGTPTQLIPYPQEQLCLPRLSSRKCVVYFHHLGVGFFPTWGSQIGAFQVFSPAFLPRPANIGFFPMVHAVKNSALRQETLQHRMPRRDSFDLRSWELFTKKNDQKSFQKHTSTVWGMFAFGHVQNQPQWVVST